MPKGAKKARDVKAESYVHTKEEGASRKNIPESGMVDYAPKTKDAKKQYCWDPRESPQLVWAGKAGLKKVEVDEQTSLEVPLVNLHIHERVSTEAILRSVQREDAQRSLFADPELDFQKEIQYYKHDVDWSNRMILGDSLLVMNSLLEREGMRGSVQCIYMDPPYGIKYASNFQPRIDQRDVKDGKDEDLTREVMQVQAFRDTWELGVHSYLTYLRDRLLLSRELLADSGSIFVQIGDENVHRVRCLMDEVFGEGNFCCLIPFVKTSGQTDKLLSTITDFILWYAKDSEQVKYRQLYEERSAGTLDSAYTWIENEKGARKLSSAELNSDTEIRGRRLMSASLFSQGFRENTSVPYMFRSKRFDTGKDKNWKTTLDGLDRLGFSDRLVISGDTLCYKRFSDDFPVVAKNNLWDDTVVSTFVAAKAYVVQTATKVIARCIHMTTDPGDLVLDPTCGSGTTAYVAEQWGRRWITIDTSRVALAIARHRLMTAAFDYYKLRHPNSGVSGGFVYKTVPHITLKSIAQNTEIDKIAEEYQTRIAAALAEVNKVCGKDWKEWEVPRQGFE